MNEVLASWLCKGLINLLGRGRHLDALQLSGSAAGLVTQVVDRLKREIIMSGGGLGAWPEPKPKSISGELLRWRSYRNKTNHGTADKQLGKMRNLLTLMRTGV